MKTRAQLTLFTLLIHQSEGFFQALNVFLTNSNEYNFIVFIIIAVAITCLLLIAHFSVGFAISVGFKSALMVL